MPIIAQIMIPMRFGKDGLVEILKEEVNRCGCLDLVTESDRLDTPIKHLLKVIRSIDGVVCNDAGVCCTTNISGFSAKLKKFRGDS